MLDDAPPELLPIRAGTCDCRAGINYYSSVPLRYLGVRAIAITPVSPLRFHRVSRQLSMPQLLAGVFAEDRYWRFQYSIISTWLPRWSYGISAALSILPLVSIAAFLFAALMYTASSRQNMLDVAEVRRHVTGPTARPGHFCMSPDQAPAIFHAAPVRLPAA